MNILILYFEPSIRTILQMTLEAEGYPVMTVMSAAEAVQIIDASSDTFLLLADNYHVNPEARQAFTMLHERPALRSRVTIIGIAAFDAVATQLKADGLMDDHLRMPFTYEQVIGIVKAHEGPASGSMH